MAGTPLETGFGFETVGAEDGDASRKLGVGDYDDTVLVSFVDAPFGADEGLVNEPLSHVSTWVLPPDLMNRSDVPFELEGSTVGATQAEPNEPITKGDWLAASGKLKVNCGEKGNSVRMNVEGLVPHRVYTVWALWLWKDSEGNPVFHPYPLGGAPNSYVTDKSGNAIFERDLKLCPAEAATEGVDGKRLAIIDTHLHSDHIAFGAIPAPITGGFPPGTVLHAQLEWDLGAGAKN